jgi:hypothetical protein
MPNLRIPVGPHELTPEWLTHALRDTRTISGATVTSFDIEMLAAGVGLMGQLARVTLHYDRPEAPAPRTLIAKFPAEAEENREVGNSFRFYEREVRFYEEIADDVELRTPRCYHSAMDVEADEYVLLLEDLAPARVGDQIAGCSAEEAELAIRELAKFHAAWWDSPRLAEIDWMPLANDPVNKSVEGIYQDAWDPFVERFGDRVPKSVLETGEKLAERSGKLLDELAEPPRTIYHGDYRIDNLFFATPDGGDPLAVIDWQISARGCGLYDVGYFVSQSLRPEARETRGMDLLKTYHRTLVENGVRGYGFDQCLHDYRLATLFCLVYPVIVGGTLDLSNERGVALANSMVERGVNAIVDLRAGELMPE